MTLVASVPRRLPRPLTAVFWVTVIAFGLLSLAIAIRYPGTTYAGRSVEAAVAKLLAGSALDRGRPLPLGSDGADRPQGRCSGWPHSPGRSRNGTTLPRAWGRCSRSDSSATRSHPPSSPTRSWPIRLGRLASPLERLTIVVAYRRHGACPRSTCGAFLRTCGASLPSMPAKLAARPRQPGVLRRSATVSAIGYWWDGPSAFVALALGRLLRASGPIRRLTAPVLIAGCAYLLLVLAAAAQSVASGVIGTGSLAPWLWFAQAAALCAIGLAVAWSWLLRRRTRSLMAGLVVELGRSPPPGGLQEMLGRILGDPALRVAYAIEGRQAHGRLRPGTR